SKRDWSSDVCSSDLLADDMGLGKTVQSIAYILSEPGDTPHLIVAPSSVLYNWKNECEKFAPDLEVAVMTGAPAERVKMIEENDKIGRAKCRRQEKSK